jgi:hypothetical protein
MGAGGPPPGIEGPPGPDTGGPPPPDEGGEDFANSLEALQVAQEALQAFIRLDPDHADRAVAAQCLQNVIKLIQSNKESADGGDLMSLTRALQGGPSANTGGAAGY